MKYIHHAILYTPTKKIDNGALLIDGESISAVGSASDLPCPAGAKRIDAQGLRLAPGFIDLQINGAFGLDFTANPETIWQVGENLTRFGVTAFLPTLVSSPLQTVKEAQGVLQKGSPSGYHGARPLGLHLEGPFLNPAKCGAHDPSCLLLPDLKLIQHWSPESNVRMATLAPELPGAIQVVKKLVKQGVVVSAGHSLANFDEAQQGFAAGIRYGTHLFNAMPPLDHRHPGLAGALLVDPRPIVGMIVDGIHLHPSTISLAWRALGAQRTSLVTDAMAALGMPPGEYNLGGRSVLVDGYSARLADGRLAGSLLSLDQALRNLVAFTGCTLIEALATVTHVPAALLGLDAHFGMLVPGANADLVWLTPDMQVVQTWINGAPVYVTGD